MEGFPNQQNGATRQEIYAYRLGRRQAMGVAQEREARRGQVGAREELREHRQMARHRARQQGHRARQKRRRARQEGFLARQEGHRALHEEFRAGRPAPM